MRKLIKLKSLFILCLVICFCSCEKPQEIKTGQIWRYYADSRNNPFETAQDVYYEVTDVKGDWCSYKASDSTSGSFKSCLMRVNAECTNCR